ncbi:MAG: EAL domain-containing protein [Actinobacteria bacterium]|nr:EAL domain-containing protein [Actinomycetota bacterium]
MTSDRADPRLSAPAARWTLPLLVALGAVSLVHVWQPRDIVGDVTYLLATVLAGPICLLVALRLPRKVRTPWLWMAAGMSCSGIAELLFEIIHWTTGENPDLSVADAFYLSSYVLLGIGLIALGRQSDRLDVDMLLDLASATVLSILIVYQVTDVSGIFADGSVPLASRIVSALYPVFDAALLALLTTTMVAGRLRGRPGWVLAIALWAWMAADFAAMLFADADIETTWMDLGWMWGTALVAVAATQVRVAPSLSTPPRREGMNLLLGLVPLGVPMAIEVWSYRHGTDPNPIPLMAATVLLIAIAFARSTRLLRERDAQEAQVLRSERYYRALALNSAEAVLVIGPDGRLLNDVPNLSHLSGGLSAHRGELVLDLLRTAERPAAQVMLERLRANFEGVSELTFPVTDSDGSKRWFGIRSRNLTGDPDVGGLVVSVHDVTDRHRAEAELTHQAFHDSLTGLPNRALFHDRVEHAMRRNQRTGFDLAVVYLDLDGFKDVNDTLGHDVGDEVLRETATRLLSSVRPFDTVARLGGDEFAILIESSTRALDDATIVADRVLQAMTAPLHVADTAMVLSASIGIAISDAESTSSSLLRDADVAMYHAKSNGKARWAVYDEAMRSVVVDRLELEADLAQALELGQLEVRYQPVVRLSTGDVAGFEALLRWHHPDRGVVLPSVFVPIAEDNGCILLIGEWVLREACRTAAGWQRRDPERRTTIAVNVSARQLATPQFVDQVRAALQDTGLDPRLLVLELTESSLVHDPMLVAERLRELHELQVRIAVDDFGTGYSSLTYLRQFPVDILKIDQSFVGSISDDDRNPPILRGLLDLAKTLDLETVAEGIEGRVQADSLRAQDCEFGQGFLYASALSAAGAEEMLHATTGQSSRPAAAAINGPTSE